MTSPWCPSSPCRRRTGCAPRPQPESRLPNDLVVTSRLPRTTAAKRGRETRFQTQLRSVLTLDLVMEVGCGGCLGAPGGGGMTTAGSRPGQEPAGALAGGRLDPGALPVLQLLLRHLSLQPLALVERAGELHAGPCGQDDPADRPEENREQDRGLRPRLRQVVDLLLDLREAQPIGMAKQHQMT